MVWNRIAKPVQRRCKGITAVNPQAEIRSAAWPYPDASKYVDAVPSTPTCVTITSPESV